MKLKALAIDLGLTLLLVAACVALYVKDTRAQKASAPSPASVKTLQFVKDGGAIAVWRDSTRTLVITRSMPNDALICVRDEDHCDSVEGWLERLAR